MICGGVRGSSLAQGKLTDALESMPYQGHARTPFYVSTPAGLGAGSIWFFSKADHAAVAAVSVAVVSACGTARSAIIYLPRHCPALPRHGMWLALSQHETKHGWKRSRRTKHETWCARSQRYVALSPPLSAATPKVVDNICETWRRPCQTSRYSPSPSPLQVQEYSDSRAGSSRGSASGASGSRGAAGRDRFLSAGCRTTSKLVQNRTQQVSRALEARKSELADFGSHFHVKQVSYVQHLF